MFSAFTQAIRGLIANPARTVLTTLGIVIGIATVILVLSAGAGFRSLIDAQVDTLGSNTLFIQTRVPPTTKNRAAGSGAAVDITTVAITTFKQRDLDDINKLGNVQNTYGMVNGLAVVSYRDVQKSVIYYGASASRFDIDKNTLAFGRFYSQTEESGADQVVLLGNKLATDLFGEDDPQGKIVRIGTLNFQVIGVYTLKGGIASDEDNSLFMPLLTAQKKMLGIDHMTIGVVQVTDIKSGDATAEDIRGVLRDNHNITDPEKDDFIVQTQAQALETFNTIFNGITLLLIAIAAISLIVGGVGIMNIMYVVVTERTSEIGLKKALGARNSDILREFLIEAVLVTTLGGVIGILFGALLGWLVSLVATSANLTWAFSVPPYAIILGFGVSAVIGIGFGVLPARSASKLDPVEAMRYE
jgi:putative ABC transport system permease protein